MRTAMCSVQLKHVSLGPWLVALFFVRLGAADLRSESVEWCEVVWSGQWLKEMSYEHLRLQGQKKSKTTNSWSVSCLSCLSLWDIEVRKPTGSPTTLQTTPSQGSHIKLLFVQAPEKDRPLEVVARGS